MKKQERERTCHDRWIQATADASSRGPNACVLQWFHTIRRWYIRPSKNTWRTITIGQMSAGTRVTYAKKARQMARLSQCNVVYCCRVRCTTMAIQRKMPQISCLSAHACRWLCMASTRTTCQSQELSSTTVWLSHRCHARFAKNNPALSTK